MVSETVGKIIEAEKLQSEKEISANEKANMIIDDAQNKAQEIINNAYKKAQKFESELKAKSDKQIDEKKAEIIDNTNKDILQLNKKIAENSEKAIKAVLDIMVNKL